MKKCYKCKEEKPFTEFSLDPSRKDGYTNRCKLCKKIYSKNEYTKKGDSIRLKSNQYRLDNPQKIRGYNQKQSEKRLTMKMDALKYKGGKCVDCGIESNVNNRVIFDFHHKDPLKKEVSLSSSSMISLTWERICQELDKCELLCSNCHKLRHDHYKRGLRSTL
jgi:hypothetical protein